MPRLALQKVLPGVLVERGEHAVVGELEDVVAVDHRGELEQRVDVVHPQALEGRVDARGRGEEARVLLVVAVERPGEAVGTASRGASAWAGARSARGGGRCCRCGCARRCSRRSRWRRASTTHEHRMRRAQHRARERGMRAPDGDRSPALRWVRSGGDLAGGAACARGRGRPAEPRRQRASAARLLRRRGRRSRSPAAASAARLRRHAPDARDQAHRAARASSHMHGHRERRQRQPRDEREHVVVAVQRPVPEQVVADA